MNFIKFNQALEALKNGKAIKRANWGSQCIYLTKGSYNMDKTPTKDIEGVTVKLFDKGDHGTVTRLPHISMKMAKVVQLQDGILMEQIY